MFLSLAFYALFGFLCSMFEIELTKVYIFITKALIPRDVPPSFLLDLKKVQLC